MPFLGLVLDGDGEGPGPGSLTSNLTAVSPNISTIIATLSSSLLPLLESLSIKANANMSEHKFDRGAQRSTPTAIPRINFTGESSLYFSIGFSLSRWVECEYRTGKT